MNGKIFYYSIMGYFLFVILGSLIFITWKEACRQKECPCSAELAKEIATIYVMAGPINESENYPVLVSRLRELYPDLDNRSELIRCMRVIGKRFLCAGLQSFMDHEVAKERIYEIGIEAHVSPVVSERSFEDLISGSLDLYNFGRELIWLSNVLPSAVRGDSTLYFNSGNKTRSIIRNWILSNDGIIADDPITTSFVNEVFKKYNAEYYSLNEEQMFIYCILAGY